MKELSVTTILFLSQTLLRAKDYFKPEDELKSQHSFGKINQKLKIEKDI